MDIYMGDTTEIWRNGKVIGDTEVTSGIRQGCTGSPQLFVMVVNIVINSIVESKLSYRDEGFYIPAPVEFVFQEQSYSSLHSGRSYAWDHVRGVIAIPEAIGGRRCGDADRCATR